MEKVCDGEMNEIYILKIILYIKNILILLVSRQIKLFKLYLNLLKIYKVNCFNYYLQRVYSQELSLHIPIPLYKDCAAKMLQATSLPPQWNKYNPYTCK